jgi:hypothetical protein
LTVIENLKSKTNMKKNSVTIFATALAVTLSCALAFGGPGNRKGKGNASHEGPDAATVFDAIDTDGDGSISAKELGESKRFKDADKKEVGAAFKEKDLDGDGSISGKEFARTFGKHGGGKEKGKGKGKGGKGKGGN